MVGQTVMRNRWLFFKNVLVKVAVANRLSQNINERVGKGLSSTCIHRHRHVQSILIAGINR